MRLLLDTHEFLWWLADHPSLSRRGRTGIDAADAEVFVSAANVMAAIESPHFVPLAITVRHGQVAGSLAGSHRDAIDRMPIAHAIVEDLIIVSNERAFDAYGVRRLW